MTNEDINDTAQTNATDGELNLDPSQISPTIGTVAAMSNEDIIDQRPIPERRLPTYLRDYALVASAPTEPKIMQTWLAPNGYIELNIRKMGQFIVLKLV